MRTFKKSSAVLSLLLIFAISVGTFPVSAMAQYYFTDENGSTYTYNGEIQAPNSSVLSNIGTSVSGSLPFEVNYPNSASFSQNNGVWETSVSQTFFSIVGNDNVGTNCTVSMSENDIALNVVTTDENGTTWTNSCSPTVVLASQRGNLQTSEVLPLATFKQDTLTGNVELLPNDPNNVRLTVSVDTATELYGARFQRIDGVSDWVGHVSTTDGINPGDVERANDTALPEGVKVADVPISTGGPDIYSRNSDIIYETQPKCTWTSDDDFWSGTAWIQDCIAYALSADGRTGTAQSRTISERSGGFGVFVGIVVMVVGLAYGGIVGLGAEGELAINLSWEGLTGSALSTTGSTIYSVTAGTAAVVVASMLQSAEDGSYGTVEDTIASSVPPGTNGGWSWTWSDLPVVPLETTFYVSETGTAGNSSDTSITVPYNGTADLHYGSTGVTGSNCFITTTPPNNTTGSSLAKTPNGTGTVNTGALTNTTTYDFYCADADGTTSDPKTVTVTVVPTSIVPTLTQDKDSTLPNESFTLTWGVTPLANAQECSVTYTGPSSGTVSNEKSGSVSVPISPNTLTIGEYTVTNTCISTSGAEASATLNHTVIEPIAPFIRQSKDITTPGEEFTIEWGSIPEANTRSCSVNSFDGSILNARSGSRTVALTAPRNNYEARNTCTDIRGNSIIAPSIFHAVIAQNVVQVSRSVSVTVCSGSTPTWNPNTNNCVAIPTPPAPTCTLSASPSAIQTGSSSSLSWTTSNAVSFSINQGIGSVTPVASGSRSVSPNTTRTYTGTATASGGQTATCSRTITVTATPPPPPPCDPPNTMVNGVCTPPVDSNTPNDNNNQAGQGGGGGLSVNISANPNRVESGGTSIISWSASGVRSCEVTGPTSDTRPFIASGNANNSNNFTRNSPYTTIITDPSIFTITCQTDGGSITADSVTVNTLTSFEEF